MERGEERGEEREEREESKYVLGLGLLEEASLYHMTTGTYGYNSR